MREVKMWISKAAFEALERRVAALEAALELPQTEEQRKKQEELARQWDALWNYDGKKKGGDR